MLATVASVGSEKARGATPATVMLTNLGVEFEQHEYGHDPNERNFGAEAARAIGVDPDRVFKTLLASVEGIGSPGVAVGIVPVSGQLSLKELATAVGGKRAEMCDPVVAQRLTGYVLGGISPFGQKKRLPTAIDETCELWDTIFVSGGKRGFDIEVAPADLISVLSAVTAPIGVSK